MFSYFHPAYQRRFLLEQLTAYESSLEISARTRFYFASEVIEKRNKKTRFGVEIKRRQQCKNLQYLSSPLDTGSLKLGPMLRLIRYQAVMKQAEIRSHDSI